jgi:hypothetical protein
MRSTSLRCKPPHLTSNPKQRHRRTCSTRLHFIRAANSGGLNRFNTGILLKSALRRKVNL